MSHTQKPRLTRGQTKAAYRTADNLLRLAAQLQNPAWQWRAQQAAQELMAILNEYGNLSTDLEHPTFLDLFT